jgi:phosphoribosylamine--glycine ligase
VSGGYPGDYEKEQAISGLKEFQNSEENIVFHGGTKAKDGNIVTSGGRVFCVTSLSKNLDDAIEASREAIDNIDFENKYYRRDIGYEFIKDLA